MSDLSGFTEAQFDRALALAFRIVGVMQRMPADMIVSVQEQKLVENLEAEVDQVFGPDARLHGRAVALYAVRDLLRPGS
jgi:uncharacterized UPF0146 family protein